MRSQRSGRALRGHPSLGGAVAAACLSVALLAGCGDDPQTMVASAKTYLEKKDYNAAGIQLKNALLEDANFAEARFLLGKVYLEQGDAFAAVKELKRAEELGYASDAVAPELAKAMLRSGDFDQVLKAYGERKLPEAGAQARLLATVGDARIAKGDVAGAKAAYEGALAADASVYSARIGLGRTRLASGDIAGARAEAEAVAKQEPSAPEAHALLAETWLAERRPDEAVAALDAAVAAKPSALSYHFRLVSLLLSVNRLDEAKERLAAMKKVAPAHPSTRYLQAFVDFREDRFQEARNGVQLVLKGTPDYLPAHLLAGSVLVRLNDYVAARPHLNKVLERAPQQPLARRLLVASYLGTGESARALEALQPLLQQSQPSEDASLMALAGQVYLANGDFDAAESYLSRAVSKSPNDATNRARLGVAKMASGDTDGAFADLEAASSLDQSTAQADLALVFAHMRRGEYDKALEAQKELERKEPNNPQTYNLKGGVFLAKKDMAEARKAFEKAVSVQPNYLPAITNLVRLDLQDKKPAEAKARYEKLVAQEPRNSDALVALAEVQRTTGAPAAEVLATLEKAAAVAPAATGPKIALIQQHLRMQQPNKALTIAQTAVTANPTDVAALEVLAHTQLATGDRQQAISSFTKLVSLQQQAPGPLVDLAEAQRLANDLSGAEQTLLRALAVQRDHVLASQRLVMLRLQTGNQDGALTLTKRMQQQHADNPLGYLLEGDVRMSANQWAEAATAYRRAFEQGESAELVNKLHSALSRAGRRAEADKVASSWLASHPRDLVVLGYLGESALSERRYAEAARQFKSMLEIAPNNVLILNNLAWVANEMKDPAALSYAERALAAEPNNPVVLDTVGNIEINVGKQEAGIAKLAKAVSLAPDLAQLRLNLAKAYVKVGRKTEAKKEIDTLMATAKDGSPLQAEVRDLAKTL